MSRMQLAISAIICGCLVTFVASRAQADLFFYTDRATWESVSTTLFVEDFEEANVGDSEFKAMGNPLDQFTNNDIFTTGQIEDGIRIVAPGDNSDTALVIVGANLAPGKSVFANVFGNGLDAQFYNNGITAVGADALSFAGDSTRIVSVFDTNDQLLGTRSYDIGTGGTFVGVTSDVDIGRVEIGGAPDDVPGFDRVDFGVAVPEPTSLWFLLGLAAVLIAVPSMRHARRRCMAVARNGRSRAA